MDTAVEPVDGPSASRILRIWKSFKLELEKVDNRQQLHDTARLKKFWILPLLAQNSRLEIVVWFSSAQVCKMSSNVLT